eukprot:TRINITY_DN49055_c0_g1_i1.p1 TRINITY_DN49055_c0_g1~~TRINITY_DN49055_c0_g1_i1.p1  ORF type:complete len:255 (-),score=36.28 TRINITY_DN49055_c0_g1_i1:67-804(-)
MSTTRVGDVRRGITPGLDSGGSAHVAEDAAFMAQELHACSYCGGGGTASAAALRDLLAEESSTAAAAFEAARLQNPRAELSSRVFWRRRLYSQRRAPAVVASASLDGRLADFSPHCALDSQASRRRASASRPSAAIRLSRAAMSAVPPTATPALERRSAAYYPNDDRHRRLTSGLGRCSATDGLALELGAHLLGSPAMLQFADDLAREHNAEAVRAACERDLWAQATTARSNTSKGRRLLFAAST